MSKPEPLKSRAEQWWPFLAILAATFAAWGLWGFVYVPWAVAKLPDPMEKAGLLGDLFGGVNALFTAFAFAAVWWTGWMQRAELQLQRRELQLQRDELSDTRAVFARQNFESNFFRLLQLVRDISQASEHNGSIGFAAVASMATMAKRIIRDTKQPADLMEGRNRWAAQYHTMESDLGPLFRTLYQMFSTIDSQIDMSEHDKRYYAKLARAQLSSDVLVLIAINAISDRSESFVPLIEKYSILKHYPSNQMLVPFKAFLPARAFMSSEERAAENGDGRQV